MTGLTLYMSFENELLCVVCDESNHHGYVKDGSFVCHPCCGELYDAMADEWTGRENEELRQDVRRVVGSHPLELSDYEPRYRYELKESD